MSEPVSEPRPYQRVYADLRARIERGELVHGAQLPSQPALAAEYGVALLTVRHAIELLRRAGYVSVEHGRGTFVTDPRGADTVLVVDDDARVRSVLVEHVAYAGFRVLEAANGLEALDVLGSEPVSLVFTDLRMPTMDGIELLRRARPRYPSTIFIVVSAYPDDLVALYRTDAFPITVIPKPFRAEQVRRALALLRGPENGNGNPTASSVESRASMDRGEGRAVVPAARPVSAASVLIVDDDAFHRATLGEMMTAQGHSVREAADGVTAIEAVSEERFSHVFLEVHLPGLGGIELARLIRERDPKTVTILMSADQQDALRGRQAGLGPTMTLIKPLSPAHVVAALRLVAE
ncbi:MAG: response regulator [Chloroflexi bacterium]|nr:response regulator [Chloroflexota bacterium]